MQKKASLLFARLIFLLSSLRLRLAPPWFHKKSSKPAPIPPDAEWVEMEDRKGMKKMWIIIGVLFLLLFLSFYFLIKSM